MLSSLIRSTPINSIERAAQSGRHTPQQINRIRNEKVTDRRTKEKPKPREPPDFRREPYNIGKVPFDRVYCQITK